MGDVNLSTLKANVPLGGFVEFPLKSPIVFDMGGMTFLRSDSYLPSDQTALAGTQLELAAGTRMISVPPKYVATANNTGTTAAGNTSVSSANNIQWEATVAGNRAAVVYYGGYVLYTLNQGVTWYQVNLSANWNSLHSACFHNNLLWTCGIQAGSGTGVVCRTDPATDGHTITSTPWSTGAVAILRAMDSSSPTDATGKLIVCGDSGQLTKFVGSSSSPQSVTHTLGTSKHFQAIRYINGVWYVGTSVGDIATSTDGDSFTTRTSGTTSTVINFMLINGEVHAILQNNTTTRKTADNGVTWQAGITLPVAPGGASSLSKVGSLLISQGGNATLFTGSTIPGVWISSDHGVTWALDPGNVAGNSTARRMLFQVGTKAFAASGERTEIQEVNGVPVVGSGLAMGRTTNWAGNYHIQYMRVK